ncbi:MAG TPA: hypothetical protein VJ717_00535 [Gemmatimonadaceae bacterium]|nr:hypothetical protein [Gemmatimonadaceae bacterium]
MRRHKTVRIFTLALLLAGSIALPAQGPSSREKVLIRAPKPYGALVAQIVANGGTVTYQYEYIDAIAAELPASALTAVRDRVGTAAISKDLNIELPRDVGTPSEKQLPAAPEEADDMAVLAEALSADSPRWRSRLPRRIC